MKKKLVESLKKNVKKYAKYAVMFAFLMFIRCQPVLAASDATSAITGKFDVFFTLLCAVVQGVGSVILLWHAFEFGASLQSQEGGGAVSRSLRGVGGAFVMLIAPTLAKAFL